MARSSPAQVPLVPPARNARFAPILSAAGLAAEEKDQGTVLVVHFSGGVADLGARAKIDSRGALAARLARRALRRDGGCVERVRPDRRFVATPARCPGAAIHELPDRPRVDAGDWSDRLRGRARAPGAGA